MSRARIATRARATLVGVQCGLGHVHNVLVSIHLNVEHTRRSGLPHETRGSLESRQLSIHYRVMEIRLSMSSEIEGLLPPFSTGRTSSLYCIDYCLLYSLLSTVYRCDEAVTAE